MELLLSLHGNLGFHRTPFEEQCPKLVETNIIKLFCSLKQCERRHQVATPVVTRTTTLIIMFMVLCIILDIDTN